MTSISPDSYPVLLQQIDGELVNVNLSDRSALLANYITINRLSQNLDLIRRDTFQKSISNSVSSQLHYLDKSIQDMKFEIEYKIGEQHQQYQKEQELIRKETLQKERGSISEPACVEDEKSTEDEQEIETLRHRLLSTKNIPSQLDAVKTIEDQNQYHESFQKELIDALPSMVSTIKLQALQFKDAVAHDAIILKEATENFDKSHNRFDYVNTALAKYNKEGKLGWIMYIIIIASILVAFLFFVLLIRLIPAR